MIFRQKNTIFFENYNLTPLDMYNELSQVYIVSEEKAGFQVGPTFPIFPYFFDLLLLFPNFS